MDRGCRVLANRTTQGGPDPLPVSGAVLPPEPPGVSWATIFLGDQDTVEMTSTLGKAKGCALRGRYSFLAFSWGPVGAHPFWWATSPSASKARLGLKSSPQIWEVVSVRGPPGKFSIRKPGGRGPKVEHEHLLPPEGGGGSGFLLGPPAPGVSGLAGLPHHIFPFSFIYISIRFQFSQKVVRFFFFLKNRLEMVLVLNPFPLGVGCF